MRPAPNEYAPYYQRYIDLVPDTVLEALQQQCSDFTRFVRAVPPEKADLAYAPGKWTVKEVIGHMIDTERIMACRALRIARGDKTPLPGFEQDDYVIRGHFASRDMAGLADEFETLRCSNLFFFKSLDETALTETGIASDKPVSVRALIYIIAGHTHHHYSILKDKYLI